MRRMQDALCPACGAVFRARAHSIECIEAPLDPRYLEIALTINKEYVDKQLQELTRADDDD